MIKSLIDYYDQLSKKGILPRPNWNITKVTAAIEIDRDGNVLAVHDLHKEIETVKKDKSGKQKSTFRKIPSEYIVPQIPGRSSGIKPGYLCDNSKYMLGFDTQKQARTSGYFEAAKNNYLEITKNLETDAASAMKNYFESFDIEKLSKNDLEKLDTGNVIFRYNGQFLQEYPELQEAWDRFKAEDGEEGKQICSVTGRMDSIAKTHPVIKGVDGAQSSGAALVSFNKDSFKSYGMEQNLNSGIGSKAALAYTTSLNYLLSKREAHASVGTTTIVYWAESAESQYQELISALAGNPTSEQIQSTLDSIFKAIASHRQIDIDSIDLNEKFHILGLSPNSARLVVRFYHSGSFGDLLKNIQKHSERMKVRWSSKYIPDVLHPWRIAAATISDKSSDKKDKSPLSGELLEAIINDTPYPETLYSRTLLRIRTEPGTSDTTDWVRASVLRGFLIKNRRYSERSLTLALNEDNNSQAYLLGRLFSVLEFLQEAAAGSKLSSTIKDKYFGSASATPAQVFPLLLKNSANHLSKISKDEKKFIHFDKSIGSIINKLGTSFPKTLSLEEQGEFYLGYYQQRQKQFEKKEKTEEKE